MTDLATEGLEITGLSASWGSTGILQDVNIHVQRGEIVAILGRNGVGKTTLLKSIMRVGPSITGGISLAGRDIAHLSTPRIAALGVGYVPDVEGVFARLTVEENLLVGRRGRLRRKEAASVVEEGLSYFPMLKDHRSRVAGSLSGGQQRMLAIARVLIARPNYILLDEPTEGLHSHVMAEVADLVRRMRDDYGAGVIWVDSRLGLSLELGDRFLVMDRRSIVMSGATCGADRAQIAGWLAP